MKSNCKFNKTIQAYISTDFLREKRNEISHQGTKLQLETLLNPPRGNTMVSGASFPSRHHVRHSKPNEPVKGVVYNKLQLSEEITTCQSNTDTIFKRLSFVG